jgi:hypothetical protein
LRIPRADKVSLEEFKKLRWALEHEGKSRAKKVVKAV